jgi:(2Fe-2S) ferredoxin
MIPPPGGSRGMRLLCGDRLTANNCGGTYMSFDEIKQRALKEWEEFNSLSRPRILLGAATCGRASGIRKIREKLEEELKSKSVEADIREVGCLGMCFAEPMLEIGLPDGRRILYKDLTPEMAPALVEEVIVKGNTLPESAMCTFGDVAVEGIPRFQELPMIKPQVRIVLRNSGRIDPTNIYHYIANGGYSGLKRAL